MTGISREIAIVIALFWAAVACAQSDTRVARIGILAHRGPEAAIQHWVPLSEYLSTSVPGWRFEILPVTLISAAEKIAAKEIEFLITNPGHFVALAEDHSLSAIATRERLVGTEPPGLLNYGTVILVRKDSGIRTIGELRGRTMAAVSPEAFGGFQIAWSEMMRQGVDPFDDLGNLRFMGFPQDAIVAAVLDGEVDAGVVRSSLLESLQAEGRIDMAELEILNSLAQPDYPFRITGHLFPEWPFVALPGVDKDLKESVSLALIGTQDPAVTRRFGLEDAWSTPLSYGAVRRLIADYKTRKDEESARTDWIGYAAIPLAFLLGLLASAVLAQRARTARRHAGPDRAEAPIEATPEDPVMTTAREKFQNLTPRELEVLSLICSGQPSKTIASELGVSLKTVEFHRSNLLKKTDAGSTAHLVQLATRLGFDLGFSPVEIRH